MLSLKVYIAAPYTKGDVLYNIRRAILAGSELLKAGHYPYIPHLLGFLHLVELVSYTKACELDLAFLPSCDALIRLSGESEGADREVKEAEKLKIPIFKSVEHFLKIAPDLKFGSVPQKAL